MGKTATHVTEQLQSKLFEHLDRYRVDGLDQGAQLCVLSDAANRFIGSFGGQADMGESQRLVRKYLEWKSKPVVPVKKQGILEMVSGEWSAMQRRLQKIRLKTRDN